MLLDTHAVLWWATAPERLSQRATAVVADPSTIVLVSMASAWETEIKAALGKLKIKGKPSALFKDLIIGHDFRLQGIELADIDRLSSLKPLHRDPFDRMLVAQALERDAILVTKDGMLAQYGGETLW